MQVNRNEIGPPSQAKRHSRVGTETLQDTRPTDQGNKAVAIRTPLLAQPALSREIDVVHPNRREAYLSRLCDEIAVPTNRSRILSAG